MNLDLTDEETAALLMEARPHHRADRYYFTSQRVSLPVASARG